MNRDTIAGNWMQLKGMIQEKWGKLTDDDLDMINGRRDKLLGKIQERYGIAREKAEDEIRGWEKTQTVTW